MKNKWKRLQWWHPDIEVWMPLYNPFTGSAYIEKNENQLVYAAEGIQRYYSDVKIRMVDAVTGEVLETFEAGYKPNAEANLSALP